MVLKSMNLMAFFNIIGGYFTFYCLFTLLSNCSQFSSSYGVSSESELLVGNGMERLFRVFTCGILLSLASNFSL